MNQKHKQIGEIRFLTGKAILLSRISPALPYFANRVRYPHVAEALAEAQAIAVAQASRRQVRQA